MLDSGTICSETKKQNFPEWLAAVDRAAEVGDFSMLMSMFYEQGWQGKEKIISIFRGAPDKTIFPHLERCLRDNENAGLRNAAMEIYVGLGKRSLPRLIGLLRDGNEEVRTFSAVMLGRIRDPDAVQPLIESLADPDLNVKHAASEALGQIKDKRAVPALIEVLQSDMWLQFPAAVALGELGDPRAVAPLISLLDMPGANVPAIQALGKIGDPTAIEPLTRFLEDDEESLREWALEAVATIASRITGMPVSMGLSEKAQRLLIETLKSDSLKAKRNAVIVLGAGRVRSAVPLIADLIADRDLREDALEAIAAIGGEDAFDALMSYAVDSDPLVRRAAVSALSGLGTEKAMKAVLPFLSDPSEEVRMEAALALAKFDSDDAKQAIAKMLADVTGAAYEAEKKALEAYKTLASTQPAPFVFNLSDTMALRDYISDRLGLHYDEDRLNVLYHRLSPLSVSAGFRSLGEYYRYLVTKGGSEDLHRIAAQLTNNETYFFREIEQLKAFIQSLLPNIIRTKSGTGGRAIRVLSAGCSSGEEAYTAAILLEESGLRKTGCTYEVVGMDIDAGALDVAIKARYSARSFRASPNGLEKKYFTTDGDWFVLDARIKDAVSFKHGNLLKPPAGLGAFDVILCRNVLIYFSDRSVERAANNLYGLLRPSGYLLLGHSESLCRVNTDFVPLRLEGAVVYQKA